MNDGEGNFSPAKGSLPQMITSGSCVKPFDYDNDGDQDLFVGGRVVPGKYPFPAKSYILNNRGGSFVDVTAEVAPELVQPGMVTDAIWTDINGDKVIDLLVVGEWMPIRFFINNNGTFKDETEDRGFEQNTGWWNRIIAADIDNDGDQDYIVGNAGLNSKFPVSFEEPLHVYCHDFDNSGTFDIVLGYYNNGECYPVRGRQCSSEQMPNIKKKFATYKKYGNATLIDVYGDDLDKALHYKAHNFASTVVINQGEGKFEFKTLPNEVQVSWINGIIANDFDQDNITDLLVAGNLFVAEVETGRYDASIGYFLKGNGDGSFQPVPVTQSGFNAPLDVKDMKLLNGVNGEKLIVVANNDDRLQVFRVNSSKPFVSLGN